MIPDHFSLNLLAVFMTLGGTDCTETLPNAVLNRVLLEKIAEIVVDVKYRSVNKQNLRSVAKFYKYITLMLNMCLIIRVNPL